VISLRHHLLILLSLSLGACATKVTSEHKKRSLYDPKPIHVQTGIASWYRDHRTASGERFNLNAMAAAHRTLPFGSKVRVIDLKTGSSVIVRINDRGPYIQGRIIDLTVGAARELGTYHRGVARVRIEVLREIPVLEKPNLRTAASATKRKKTTSPNPFAFLFAER
jgi:rare lipoprotein A